jgi:hypothetical protein
MSPTSYPACAIFLGDYTRLYIMQRNPIGPPLALSEKADLHLLSSFLNYANEGVSINNIVFREPTHLFRSDASEFRFGGYNLLSGIGWHFELPIDCRLQTSLNSLEFIACVISIWLEKRLIQLNLNLAF